MWQSLARNSLMAATCYNVVDIGDCCTHVLKSLLLFIGCCFIRCSFIKCIMYHFNSLSSVHSSYKFDSCFLLNTHFSVCPQITHCLFFYWRRKLKWCVGHCKCWCNIYMSFGMRTFKIVHMRHYNLRPFWSRTTSVWTR